ncbi:MAG: integration host factor subunit alpha [Burkholderiaceae bacterium]|nr:integration host factor subunit alpha [Burkholderiaceae bacterium]
MELVFDELSTATLTKADLVDALFERIGLSKREAKEVVEMFFEIIAESLVASEDDEEVKITGFGNFRVRNKNPRPGRNPRTGELVPIAARRVITFHASAKLKERVQDVPADLTKD